MKNWLAVASVAVCIGLLTCDTSMALGGSSSGGGKASTRGRFLVSNTGAAPVRVLILPAGTAIPSTLGAVEAQSFVVTPGNTDIGPRRNSGLFDIHVVDATLFAAGLAAGGPEAPSAAPDDTVSSVNLAGADVTVEVTSAGGIAGIGSISR